MNELTLWNWLKKEAKKYPNVFLYRVENAAGSGMPDVQGYIKGYGSIYIELKEGVQLKKSGIVRIKIRPSQIQWHKTMSRLGSMRHFFLIKVDKEKFLISGDDVEWLLTGPSIDFLREESTNLLKFFEQSTDR